jgi:acetylornithine deacetylase/succinyl-diaminopimelate desuccinylase-like protein
MDEAKLLRDHRQVATATLAKEPGLHAYHQVWRRPCIVVTALEASSIANATNQVLPKAEAVLNIRLVPDQDPQHCRRLIQDFIRDHVPWHLDVKVEGKGGEDAFADPWHCEPEGPIFAAALDALESAYGQQPATIGCGGTIPCIDPFWRQFQVPILLFPIGDPAANAHSSDESLHIESWKNLMKSLAAFLGNLAGRVESTV